MASGNRAGLNLHILWCVVKFRKNIREQSPPSVEIGCICFLCYPISVRLVLNLEYNIDLFCALEYQCCP